MRFLRPAWGSNSPSVYDGSVGGGGYSTEAQQFFDRITDPGTTRKDLYAAMIDSLVSNSIWSKLDALYILAAPNTATALTNLISSSYGATNHSASFTTDAGYTGNGSSAYIDSNFNPTTASSPNITQNSAALFAYSNTDGAESTGIVGGSADSGLYIIPYFSGASFLARAFGGSSLSLSSSSAKGFFAINRSDSNNVQGYRNGSSLGTSSSNTSQAPVSGTICCLRRYSDYTAKTMLCFGFGSSLSSTNHGNLYSAIHTFMQSVAGVP